MEKTPRLSNESLSFREGKAAFRMALALLYGISIVAIPASLLVGGSLKLLEKVRLVSPLKNQEPHQPKVR